MPHYRLLQVATNTTTTTKKICIFRPLTSFLSFLKYLHIVSCLITNQNGSHTKNKEEEEEKEPT